MSTHDQLEGCNAHHARDIFMSNFVSRSRSEHSNPPRSALAGPSCNQLRGIPENQPSLVGPRPSPRGMRGIRLGNGVAGIGARNTPASFISPTCCVPRGRPRLWVGLAPFDGRRGSSLGFRPVGLADVTCGPLSRVNRRGSSRRSLGLLLAEQREHGLPNFFGGPENVAVAVTASCAVSGNEKI